MRALHYSDQTSRSRRFSRKKGFSAWVADHPRILTVEDEYIVARRDLIFHLLKGVYDTPEGVSEFVVAINVGSMEDNIRELIRNQPPWKVAAILKSKFYTELVMVHESEQRFGIEICLIGRSTDSITKVAVLLYPKISTKQPALAPR
jgi:hypothetical protein